MCAENASRVTSIGSFNRVISVGSNGGCSGCVSGGDRVSGSTGDVAAISVVVVVLLVEVVVVIVVEVVVRSHFGSRCRRRSDLPGNFSRAHILSCVGGAEAQVERLGQAGASRQA